jgi:hypothetical protein
MCDMPGNTTEPGPATPGRVYDPRSHRSTSDFHISPHGARDRGYCGESATATRDSGAIALCQGIQEEWLKWTPEADEWKMDHTGPVIGERRLRWKQRARCLRSGRSRFIRNVHLPELHFPERALLMFIEKFPSDPAGRGFPPRERAGCLLSTSPVGVLTCPVSVPTWSPA